MLRTISAAVIAVATFAGLGGEAAAQATLCSDPSATCGAIVDTACLDQKRLGAGSLSAAIASDGGCGEQLERYRACLQKAALECGVSARPQESASLCTPIFEKDLWDEVKTEEDCGAYAAYVEACPNSPRLAFVRYKMTKRQCGAKAELPEVVKQVAQKNDAVVQAESGEADYEKLAEGPEGEPLAREQDKKKYCDENEILKGLMRSDRKTRIDIGLFLDAVTSEFPRFKKPGQHFEGLEAIIDYWNDRPDLKDPRWLAYILATAYHETGTRMYPVREGLARSDEAAVKLLKAYAKRSGNRMILKYVEPDARTGQSYYGRGFVQLTWGANYKKVDDWYKLRARSESVYWNPDRVLEPRFSARLLVDAMVYGWYTGARNCLPRYFPEGKEGDWRNARRMVNALDKADRLTDIGKKFLKAVKEAQVFVPETGR